MQKKEKQAYLSYNLYSMEIVSYNNYSTKEKHLILHL